MNNQLIQLSQNSFVNVYTWGSSDARTIIFLHGLGSTGYSFNELASLLSVNYRVIAIDLPGHGESSNFDDEKPFTMKSLADRLKKVIDHLKIIDFHLVGHSFGGDIGIHFTKTYHPKSLILLDGGYIRASSLPENTIEEEIQTVKQHCLNYTFSSWKEYQESLKDNGLPEHLIEASMKSMREEGKVVKLRVSTGTAKNIAEIKYNEPSEGVLCAITKPVLLLRSTLPLKFNPYRRLETNRLKKYIDLTVVDVENASHDLYWEKPEFVSKEITKWIRNSEGDS